MLVNVQKKNNQSGFTLIEIMIGLVIGLIGTLVIMQTFSLFEGQKRTTTGNADAQVNGTIALYNIQRQIQMAGFGLPIFDANDILNTSPLKCASSLIDHDGDVATANVDFFPIRIVDGSTSASGFDEISVRYFSAPNGGLPVNLIDTSGSPLFGIENTLGCAQNDLALVVKGTTCTAGIVSTTDATLATDTTHLTLTGPDVASITTGSGANSARLSCLGDFIELTYQVNGDELAVNGQAVISGIVDVQAQYGVSDSANSNIISGWQSAVGSWAAPSVADRNRIRAVRVAVLARNDLLEKGNVTTAMPVTWSNPLNGSIAPSFTLTGNWQQYRYRVYETIVPLRNFTWNGSSL
jgi:type IV pilus assembly protein PilW